MLKLFRLKLAAFLTEVILSGMEDDLSDDALEELPEGWPENPSHDARDGLSAAVERTLTAERTHVAPVWAWMTIYHALAVAGHAEPALKIAIERACGHVNGNEDVHHLIWQFETRV